MTQRPRTAREVLEILDELSAADAWLEEVMGGRPSGDSSGFKPTIADFTPPTERVSQAIDDAPSGTVAPWIVQAREHANNIWLRTLASNKRPAKEQIANEIARRLFHDDNMVTKGNKRISADYVLRFALSPSANGGWQPPGLED